MSWIAPRNGGYQPGAYPAPRPDRPRRLIDRLLRRFGYEPITHRYWCAGCNHTCDAPQPARSV